MPKFYGLLDGLEGYSDTKKSILENKNVCLSGVSGSAKAHVLFSLLKETDTHSCLIITPDEISAKQLYRDLTFLCDERVMVFPEREYMFYDLDSSSNETTVQRISVLDRAARKGGIVITTAAAAIKPVLPKKLLEKYTFTLSEADILDMDDFSKNLVLAGYSACDTVEGAGQFAVRGGLIDVFPITSECPYRIDMFGDEIDTIRSFDCFTQLSGDRVKSIIIPPAYEILYDYETAARISDKLKAADNPDWEKFSERHYFPSNDKYIPEIYPELPLIFEYFSGLFVFDEPLNIREKAENTGFELMKTIEAMYERNELCGVQGDFYTDYHELVRKSKGCILSLCEFLQSGADIPYKTLASVQVKTEGTYNGNTKMLCEDLKLYMKQGSRVVLFSGGYARGLNLSESLKNEGIAAEFSENPEAEIKGVMITPGSLSGGFEYPGLKLVFISDRDVFKKAGKKKRTVSKKNAVSSISDLTPGDYVVHINHGVGKYLGQELITAGGVTKDYLKLQYGGSDFLYVPATQLDMIHKYVGGKEQLKLNRLGGKEWKNTKSKVKASCEELAKGLIKLYAERESIKGHQFSSDTAWQQEFEESFPYTETPDQLKSIEEVKADMEKSSPMDRLLCGDVGYGKTEVAIRAAFKCVMDGMQVAYLAPTTVLALQHFNTFRERMADFAVRVEMLSRFRTPAQQKKIVEMVNNGQIDVLIGTHRILQKDLKFPNLGLLIIDEEQRFGVKHKERMKEIKTNVDVLTMTATPIPRTLHMSMIGIRDISTINTPPKDRYPVRTYVLEQNMSIVRDAIVREISRGGQVYYLFNRVEGISAAAKRISELVPSASVSFAHGQMREGELERIMIDVAEGNIDVLVCTSIIETGLDIPNANTIIIEDADRLGLSQLYQLRGRVGRSDKMAYAYLMYKKDKVLSEVARKRLAALRDFTEFGSGFKIALRDLEIRGAGNVLGPQQHGHMDSVGYELYCMMLEDEIRRQKGEASVISDVTIDLDIDAFIPKTYIKNNDTRIDIYSRIAKISSEADYNEMEDELRDRFGEYTTAVSNLLEIALLKNVASGVGISEIRQIGTNIVFYFKNAAPETIGMASLAAGYFKGRVLVSAGARPAMTYTRAAEGNAMNTLSNIKIVLHRLNELKNGEK